MNTPMSLQSATAGYQATARGEVHYELLYQSLAGEGEGLAFPCDERGQVFLDELSDRALENYLYARVVVGREFAAPAVVPARHH